jgi:hypothetical protein
MNKWLALLLLFSSKVYAGSPVIFDNACASGILGLPHNTCVIDSAGLGGPYLPLTAGPGAQLTGDLYLDSGTITSPSSGTMQIYDGQINVFGNGGVSVYDGLGDEATFNGNSTALYDASGDSLGLSNDSVQNQ